MNALTIALLTLTLNEAGLVRMTLSNAASLEACTAQAGMVTQILTDAGHEPLAVRCGETPLRLSPFVHGTPAEEETWHYRVELLAEGFAIAPVEAGACEAQEGTVYCAVSAQQPE